MQEGCGKHFASPSSLKRHAKVHKGRCGWPCVFYAENREERECFGHFIYFDWSISCMCACDSLMTWYSSLFRGHTEATGDTDNQDAGLPPQPGSLIQSSSASICLNAVRWRPSAWSCFTLGLVSAPASGLLLYSVLTSCVHTCALSPWPFRKLG